MKRFVLALALMAFTGLYAQKSADTMVIPTIQGTKLHIKGTPTGLQIKEYEGKVVFLEFWGTHCPPCLMSIPHYIDLKKKYKDQLAILAVEVQSNAPAQELKRFAASKGINYDVVAYGDAKSFVGYIAQRARWSGSIPFLLILDPKGNVVTMQVGLLREDALENVLKALLKSSAASKPANGTAKPAQSKPAKAS